MLTKIRIRGYRALKDLELDLPPGQPLVLIGENATGKTSILDALALLCAVANGAASRAIHDRGGWQAIAWKGSNEPIELLARFSADAPPFEPDGGPVEYTLRLGQSRGLPTILDEQVRIYKRGTDSPPLGVLRPGEARNLGTGQFEPVTPGLASITDESRYPTPVHVKEALQSIAFYAAFNLNGVGIGARQVEQRRRLDATGSDLLNALHTLSQESPRAWEALRTDLEAVFPWCQAIKFPPGPGRGVITMTWVDRRSGATLYLDDMSEGMRVYLALLAALHAPDAPALIAFDEPERSLHPRALRRLVKAMEIRALTTPIVVATHSDRLLDHLEDPAAALRITRFTGAEGVRLEALDRELLAAWREEYTLSELRARGMLEAPDRDVEEP